MEPMRTPQWSLAQYMLDGRIEIGVIVGDNVVAGPPPLAGHTLLEVLASWRNYEPMLRSWTPDPAAFVAEAELIAPLTYPSKILCAGANYYKHINEMGIQSPATPPEPWFFLKPPTTTVIGPNAPIHLPSYSGAQVDWEAELAVIIGVRCHDLAPEDVPHYLAGYTVANDVSARGYLTRSDPVAEPFTYDWLGHKAQDTFCPLGPGLVPAWSIPDVQNLKIRLTVNGVVKQNGSTDDMISPVMELVAAASRLVTLEPGDVLLTGTPAGVGFPSGDFLVDGDAVVVEIDLVGRLVNPVRGHLIRT